MEFSEIKIAILEAVQNVENSFIKKHSEMLDFGDCGRAFPMVSFGRKRKIKNEMIKAGLINENNTFDSYGSKGYIIKMPSSLVATQYRGFFEDRAKAASDTIEKMMNNQDLEFYVYSYGD